MSCLDARVMHACIVSTEKDGKQSSHSSEESDSTDDSESGRIKL